MNLLGTATAALARKRKESATTSNVPSTITSSPTAVAPAAAGVTIGKSKGSLGMAHAAMAAKRTRPTTAMGKRPVTVGAATAVSGGRKKPRKSSLATSTY